MVYKFNVKLKSGYYWNGKPVARTMEVAGSSTLESFCRDILNSLDFDFDHMFAFCIGRNSYEGAPPYAEAAYRCKVKLFSLGLKKGDKFTLEYDFGDSWMFEIKVQDIQDRKGGETKIIASTGSVEQYPGADDWFGDEDDFPEDLEDDEEFPGESETSDGFSEQTAKRSSAANTSAPYHQFSLSDLYGIDMDIPGEDDTPEDDWDDDFPEDDWDDDDAPEDGWDDDDTPEDGWDDDDFPEDEWDDSMMMELPEWNYHVPDALYEAAYRYKKTKLWKKLHEEEIFAVEFRDGQIGYISIMGNAGEHLSIGLYIGVAALDSFRYICFDTPLFIESYYEMKEKYLQQDCLMMILEKKEFLSPEEIEDVKRYAASNGIRLSGKNAYVQFQKFVPHHYPWHLSSAQEEQYMLEGMEAAIALASCLKDQKPLALGLQEITPMTCELPLLKHDGERYLLNGTVTVPELPPAVYPTATNLNHKLIQKLRRMKRKEAVECKVVQFPEPIADEKDDVPYFPFCLVAVGEKSGYLFPPLLQEDYESHADDQANHLLQALADLKHKPAQFLVDDRRTSDLLKEAAQALGINIEFCDELPELEEALELLFEGSESSGDSDSPVEELTEIARMMVSLPESEIRQMPKSIRQDFKRMVETGILPDDLALQVGKN